MMVSNLVKTVSTAAVLATLGFGALAAAPAQAAPGFSVQLGLGDDNGPGYGPRPGYDPRPGYGPGAHFEYNQGRGYCLNDFQIRTKLRQRGYNNVQLVQEYGPRYVIAVGSRYGAYYQLRVNRCTGSVDNIRRVSRRANGGFSIQLNF